MGLKTNLLKQYKTDKDKTEQGVWVDFENGISIRIRRLSSQASINARREAEKTIVSSLRNGKLSDEQNEEIAVHQLARGVIADWKGVTGDDGTEIPYSGDAAYEILKDEDLAEFRVEILQISLNRDSFKADADKDGLGNS